MARQAIDRFGLIHGARPGVLEQFPEWRELDWAEARSRAAAAEQERRQLLDSSIRLMEIERLLSDNETNTTAIRGRLEKLQGEISVLDHRIEQAGDARTQEKGFVDSQSLEMLDAARAAYDDLGRRLGNRAPTPYAARP